MNPNAANYRLYGGRGIRVCDRWLRSFKSFYDDMGERPSRDYSIDRINPDGDYEPGNCRWLLKRDQIDNRRCVGRYTHDGQTHTLKEWAAITGVNRELIRGRLRLGWPFSRALTEPLLSQYSRQRSAAD